MAKRILALNNLFYAYEKELKFTASSQYQKITSAPKKKFFCPNISKK